MMKCPFRAGIQFEYAYIGGNSKEEKQKSDNYVETSQHCVYEECYGGECPYYNYAGGCDRIGD